MVGLLFTFSTLWILVGGWLFMNCIGTRPIPIVDYICCFISFTTASILFVGAAIVDKLASQRKDKIPDEPEQSPQQSRTSQIFQAIFLVLIVAGLLFAYIKFHKP